MDAFKEVSRGVAKIKQADYLPHGRHPIIDQGKGMIAGYSNAEEGLFTDVPAIVFGDHTRCVKYVSESFFAGADGVKILKPLLSDNVRYWYHALRSVRLDNLGYSRHYKLLKQTTFAYVDEDIQSAVCDVLDSILAAANLARCQLPLLDGLVKSRFIEMFGKDRYPIVAIGDVSTDIRYGTSKKASENGRYIYLRMNNLTDDGRLDLSDIKRIDLTESELEKCLVEKGDLLFNRTNSREKVGKTAVFDLDEPMVIAGYIIRVRLQPEVNSVYLSTFMNLEKTKALLQAIAKGAVHQANINAQQLAAIEFPLPPLPLQQQFASFVAEVDKSRVVVQQQIEKLQTLYDSLAQDYFG
ncbi:restriction endonuclease subunit S [Enorma phocaeensis]|uniref:restriction endonuclease subunit S n=1 Tax=Enorma phocaeensis TaxID=1871019 RepID=UPI00320A2167